MEFTPQAIQKKKNQLRVFPRFKSLSEEELTNVAIEKLKRLAEKKAIAAQTNLQAIEVNTSDLATNKEEQLFLDKLLKQYLEEYVITSIAEKGMLRDLMLYEILAFRLRKRVSDESREDGRVPGALVNSIRELNTEILNIKEKMGLVKDKKFADQVDSFQLFEKLKKKARAFLEGNQLSRTEKCPHCQQFILYKIRMDRYEAGKHPYFKDMMLYNEHLFKLLEEKKITEEDVAKVLYTSHDYVKWMLKQAERNKTNVVS